MKRPFDMRSHLRRAIITVLGRLAGPENASWVRAIEEEASYLPQAQGRWIVTGLLGLVAHRAGQSLLAFIAVCMLPLMAVALMTILLRMQYLIWNSDNNLMGPVILLCSVAPFAWQLGRQVHSRLLLWSLLAFVLFQSAPMLLWPLMFGDLIGLEWGVNVEALGMPQRLAPLYALAVWVCGTVGAARIMANPKR